MSARRAAKEQIRAARERAREMRARATAHRQRVSPGHVSASPWLVVIGFVTVAAIVGAIVIGLSSMRSVHVSGTSASVAVAPQSMRPVLLVVDSAFPGHAQVAERINRIVDVRRTRGYDVITSTAHDADLLALMKEWLKNRARPADEALEDIMEAHNAYGILLVTIKGDSRRPVRSANEQLVLSTRPGSADRRRLAVETSVPAGAAPALPYLLINDHPAKTDPKVEKVINAAIGAYRERGWKLEMFDNLEVQVRKLLPPGKIERADQLSPMLRQTLDENGFAGVLRIDAAPGEGEPETRVMMTIVNASDITPMSTAPAIPEAPASPAIPPEPKSPAGPAATIESKPLSFHMRPTARFRLAIAA